MSDAPPPVPPPPPRAVLKPARRRFLGLFWILPGVVLAIVIAVVAVSLSNRGERVFVHFTEGHGLKPGDGLLCRGITVGEVRSVELSPDLKGVDVVIDLRPKAGGVAVNGSRFWIVRPQLALTGLRGLDTVVGAKYVAVNPGTGPVEHIFTGLNEPPLELEPGGLEIVVQDRRTGGLRPGAPLTYRGVRIGSVLSAGLASDASAVDVRVYVLPTFKDLVREGSVFWNVSGFKVGGSLWSARLALDFESAETMLAGGMAMATPSPPGKPVRDGQRFELADKEPDKWQEWNPSIALTQVGLPAGVSVPRLIKATLHYRSRSLTKLYLGTSQYERRGLLLPVDRTWLLAPDDLLNVPDKGELAFEGVGVAISADKEAGSLRWLEVKDPAAVAALKQSLDGKRLRPPEKREDCLLVADSTSAPLFVSEAQLKQTDEGWTIGPSLSGELTREKWHGAAAVAVKDGAVIGMLLVSEKGAKYIVPLTKELLHR